MKRQRIEAFKRTHDDWCSNFKIEQDMRYKDVKLVVVTFHKNFTVDGGLHRVSVWGNDDLGMDYDTQDELEAMSIYKDLVSLEYVDKDRLLAIGFNYF